MLQGIFTLNRVIKIQRIACSFSERIDGFCSCFHMEIIIINPTSHQTQTQNNLLSPIFLFYIIYDTGTCTLLYIWQIEREREMRAEGALGELSEALLHLTFSSKTDHPSCFVPGTSSKSKNMADLLNFYFYFHPLIFF